MQLTMENEKDVFEGKEPENEVNEVATNEAVTEGENEAEAAAENVTETVSEGVTVNAEPTVSFEPQAKPQQAKSSSTGIKVFFSLIAVAAVLVCATAAGFIFGKSTGTVTDTHKDFAKKENAEISGVGEAYLNVADSVVCVVAYNEKTGAASYASGIVYSSDGYIVINDHIYSEIASAKFKVTFGDGKYYDADYIAGDLRTDLAVIKVKNGSGFHPATFGDPDELYVGEEVFAVGYPNADADASMLVSGRISSVGTRISGDYSTYTMKMIQTDAPISVGYSGGLLVNMYSQVVGMPDVGVTGVAYNGVNYCIPVNTVVKTVDSLIEKGYVEGRGRLGITYTFVNGILAELNGVPTGLIINEVSNDSDLYGKNIAKGDIITHINDVVINDRDAALDIIESVKYGETITLTVYHPATGKSETVIGALIPDPGSSSYTNSVTTDGKDNTGGNIFGEDGEDAFSDH